ncbi:hypothetical protein [Rhodococcus jostii]|uniref:hypothetical protein n=1 Tax=Rhodococcus jostii TaxID=132919 RepID=UPI000306F317|nr:hypothetical protein [Rhodococcus jostii]
MSPNTLTPPGFRSLPDLAGRTLGGKIVPDSGTARLRLWGSVTEAGRAGLAS